MLEMLAAFFSTILGPCYTVTGNWWLAIVLFTIVTKILLLPISLWCQKNSLLVVSLMPQVNAIKVKHFGDKETIGEEQNKLYKQEGYHPLLSMLPLAIQVLILFGLVDVIRSIVASGEPGTALLGLVPVTDGGWSWIMPVLAAASSAILGVAQNHINPLQREQGKAEKASTNGLSIGLSAILGVSVASGMVFYWICSNLMAIVVQLACNLIMSPKKHVDYDALRASQAEIQALEDLSASDKKWYQKNPLAKREREDIARFYDVVDKSIVFYSEGSGFYKYFRGAIEWLLEHSDIRIHYITNDPNDQVFEIHQSQPRLIPYYMSVQKLITVMMKMDCDVFVASLADLDNYYLKRSYVRKDIEYVDMLHHTTSMHLVGAANCHDHYDTIFCAGPHQIAETRASEKLRGVPAKNLVPIGYDLLDRERQEYRELQETLPKHSRPQATHRPQALIAPSWQEDNILDLCAADTINSLLEAGFDVTVRPHPEYVKRYGARWNALKERFSAVPEGQVTFEDDFSGESSIFAADVLLTDWSSIACEFSFTTDKPTLFVDTPMKVGNPDWQEIGLVPTEISLRNQIGQSVAVEDVATIGSIACSMVDEASQWHDRIEEVYDTFIFNHGHGGEAAGRYLLDAVLRAQAQKGKKGEGLTPPAPRRATPDAPYTQDPQDAADAQEVAEAQDANDAQAAEKDEPPVSPDVSEKPYTPKHFAKPSQQEDSHE